MSSRIERESIERRIEEITSSIHTLTLELDRLRDNTKTAFLHAYNDEEILMKLRGKIVELLVQLKPTMYRKYVTIGPTESPFFMYDC